MRAVVLRGAWDLGVEELRDPEPAVGEVLIKVAGCGICHSDLHQINGDAVVALPKGLGHEVSGTIVGVGGGVPRERIGQRIVVPFIVPCADCDRCREGRDDLCTKFWTMNRRLGVLYNGQTRLYRQGGEPVWMDAASGMAELAVAPASAAFEVPSGVDLESASIMGCAMFTAYGAVRHAAGLTPADTIVVIGAGGVGTQILQIARAIGLERILAVDIDDEKLTAAAAAGATETFNASREDVDESILEATGGGADVAFEALGRGETINRALRVTRTGGRVVLIGVNPGAQVTEIDTNSIVRRQLTVVGSYGARPATDMPQLIEMVADGRLDPSSSVSRRVPLDGAAQAYRALAEGLVVGRAIVDMSLERQDVQA